MIWPVWWRVIRGPWQGATRRWVGVRRTAGNIVGGFGALRSLGLALAMSAAVVLLVLAVPGSPTLRKRFLPSW